MIIPHRMSATAADFSDVLHECERNHSHLSLSMVDL